MRPCGLDFDTCSRQMNFRGLVYAVDGRLVEWRLLDGPSDEFREFEPERPIVCDLAVGLTALDEQGQLCAWTEGVA